MTSLYLLNHRSRQHELGLDYGYPEVQLDNKTYVFRNGTWVLAGCAHTESQTKTSFKKLSARNQFLTEENIYLKLQLDVLLGMLAEATARLQAAEDKVTRKLSVDRKCCLMIQPDECSS
ncbi:protein chibby homolog 3 [Discoglossus pictus]